MDSNAGGYGAAQINYNTPSVAEMLNDGAKLNEQRNYRNQELAIQKGRLQQENTWKNFQQVQDIGKDFKSLPQRLQDFSAEHLQQLKQQFSSPEYLHLDPAELGTVIQQQVQPFAQWHAQAESAANSFDDNFKQWQQAYPNVPANEAHQWAENQFANDFFTYDHDNGKLTYMPPQMVRPRDYINGDGHPDTPSLSNMDVLGQFNVDINPLVKATAAIPTDVTGNKQVVGKDGRTQSLSWSAPTTPFSTLVKDANGIPVKSELAYQPLGNTGMRMVTPDFKQAILTNGATRAAAAKVAAMGQQLYEQKTGKKVDDFIKPHIGDMALYQFANGFMTHPVKVAEEQKAAKTTNVFNMGNQPAINDIYGKIDHAIDYQPNGEPRVHSNDQSHTVPFNELPSDVQVELTTIANSAGAKTQDEYGTPHPLTQADMFVRRVDGKMYLMQRTGNDKPDKLIAPLDYTAMNLSGKSGNTSAKQKQEVLHHTPATPAATTPATTTHSPSTIIPKGNVR